VYVWIQFVIAFTNQNIFSFHFFCRRTPTSQLAILQNLKQFKLIYKDLKIDRAVIGALTLIESGYGAKKNCKIMSFLVEMI